MLRDACGDGEDVGVEDDVAGVEADSVHQQVVGARADAHLAVLVHRLGSLLRLEIVQGIPSVPGPTGWVDFYKNVLPSSIRVDSGKHQIIGLIPDGTVCMYSTDDSGNSNLPANYQLDWCFDMILRDASFSYCFLA